MTSLFLSMCWLFITLSAVKTLRGLFFSHHAYEIDKFHKILLIIPGLIQLCKGFEGVYNWEGLDPEGL